MSAEEDGFDVLLTKIGFGRWQAVIILGTLLVVGQIPIHQVGSPMLSAPVNFRCFSEPPTDELLDFYNLWNENETYFNNKCLDVADDTFETITSIGYSGDGSYYTGLSTCPYIVYDTSIFNSTVNSEFHIVCENEYLRPLYQMLFNFGGLVGSSICGQIADKLGRKRSVVIGCIGHLVAVMLMATIPSYPVLLTMRFLIGIMHAVMLLPAWNLALEVSLPHQRSLVGMFMGLPYSFFAAANAGVAYLLRTWTYILLVGIIPGVILLPLTLILDESPRWLIQNGREEEAIRILSKAVKLNKSKLSTPLEISVWNISKMVAKSSEGVTPDDKDQSLRSRLREMMRYFRSPAMVLILVLTTPLWFIQSFVYLSVTLNVNNFTSSGLFIYLALTGVMDASAIILTTPLATRFGRKTMVFGGMFGGSSLLLAEQFIPADFDWVRWVLVMVGFFLVASAFQVNFIYGPELFPTDIRTRGFGFLNLISQAGYICTPIATEFFAKQAWWAGGVLFGVCGILGSLTVLPLPETRNKPLPETLYDLENRAKKSNTLQDVENRVEL